jgi:hypothetical protein
MEVLIVTTVDTGIASQLPETVRSKAHVQQKLSNRLAIATIEPEQKAEIAAIPGVLGVFEGEVPAEELALSETEKLAIEAWNLRHSKQFKAQKESRRGEGLSWDHPGFEREG